MLILSKKHVATNTFMKIWFKYYDAEQKMIPGIASNSTDKHWLSFPLFVGKTWTARENVKNMDGKSNNYYNKYLVESFESVTTDYGTVYAFRISRKAHNITTGWWGDSTAWYSPEVKVVVKSKHDYKRGDSLLKVNLVN